MISLDEARHLIAAIARPLDPVRLPLAKAHGYVLAEAAVAAEFFPAMDRSMMDGYAIAADDDSESFRVVGEIQAGALPATRVHRGECVRVFTGAAIPEGASRVVMQEDARREGDRMWVLNRTEKRFIRERGEEARPGEVVLRQGVRLGATELAALAQIGRATPLVHRGVQILHVATGSELVAPEATPKGGQIRDTNSALSAALFETCARVVVRRERAGDDFDSLKALIEKAPECPDLVAISGGASVGDYDFGAKVLRALGYTIHFDRVNLRPGKPLTFASRGSQIAFVIPGNPVSHFVCFHAAIRLALERLAGAAPAWSWIDVALEHAEMLRLDPRETFWPAKTVVAEGRLLAKPQRWSSSGDTFSLAGVNTLLRIAPTWQQGATAPALLLDVPSSA